MSGNIKTHNIPPYPIIPTQVVSGNVTSLVTDIFTKDNIGIQLVWDGTLNGTFLVQTSNDYVPSNNGPDAPPINPGNWSTIPFSDVASALGTPDVGFFNLNQLTARYMRIVFNYVSGTGNLTGVIVGKAI